MSKQITLEHFLPYYPDLHGKDDDAENINKNFNHQIASKKEFLVNTLGEAETTPNAPGLLMKYQLTVGRFLSGYTPYNRLLLVHSMGLGKCVLPGTNVAIGGIDNVPIEQLWEQCAAVPHVMDGEGGLWSIPTEPIYCTSWDANTKQYVERVPIRYLYRQYVNETVRELVLEDGTTLSMTKAHRIRMCDNRWANDYTVGQRVCMLMDGGKQKLAIAAINEKPYSGWVYDLDVEHTHNYVANGVSCHNTCAAIGVIEQLRRNPHIKPYDGVLIISAGTGKKNFQEELLHKCTYGQYTTKPKPDSKEAKELLVETKLNRDATSFYKFETPIKFAKKIRDSRLTTQGDILQEYSNMIIIVDEVHNLRHLTKKNEEEEEEEGTEKKKQDKEKKAVVEEKEKKDMFPDVYEEFHYFLHKVPNCIILIMTGTPMFDQAHDIADVTNLITPDTDADQLPEKNEFDTKFFSGNQLVNDTAIVDKLRRAFYGRVSYLAEPESKTISRIIEGDTIGGLKEFRVVPCLMQKAQSDVYINVYEKDAKDEKDANKKKQTKSAFYSLARQAELCVIDGKFGSNLYKSTVENIKTDETNLLYKYLPLPKNSISSKYAARFDTLRTSINTDTKIIDADIAALQDHRITELEKYSAVYAQTVKDLLRVQRMAPGDPGKGVAIVYNTFVNNGGLKLFAKILEVWFGMKEATENDANNALTVADRTAVGSILSAGQSRPYFALLTGTIPEKRRKSVTRLFNHPKNKHGAIMPFVLVSKKFSETISLKNVTLVCVQTAHWNYTRIDQLVARGIRLGSHDELIRFLQPGIKPEVHIKHYVSIPSAEAGNGDDTKSVDIHMYKTAEDKDKRIQAIRRLMMEVAFDCPFNRVQNQRDSRMYDNKRDCQYQSCNYVCYDPSGRADSSPTNRTSYENYYSSYTAIPNVYVIVEKLLRKYKELSVQDVLRLVKYGENNTEHGTNLILPKRASLTQAYSTTAAAGKQITLNDIKYVVRPVTNIQDNDAETGCSYISLPNVDNTETPSTVLLPITADAESETESESGSPSY